VKLALVSVITAAYESDPVHLRTALGSALNQTYSNLEIIVSDDSPGSQLSDVVEKLHDARIYYHHNTVPLGVAENHWKCLREARGDFVVILNHDDVLEPTFTEKLLAPLRAEPTASVAFCDHWIIDARGARKDIETEGAACRYGRSSLAAGMHKPFFDLLVRQTIPMAMGAMFRRGAVAGTLPPDAGPAYDLWLTYLLCRNSAGAWYVPERLSSWRSHSGNQTSVADISLLTGSAYCWSTIARDKQASSIRRAALKKEALALHACANWHFRRRSGEESLDYALRSLRAHPNWRAVLLYAVSILRRTAAERSRPGRSIKPSAGRN